MADSLQTAFFFKFIFIDKNWCLLIWILLRFVPQCPVDNKPSLVQIMAWRQTGDKGVSVPMMALFIDTSMLQSALMSKLEVASSNFLIGYCKYNFQVALFLNEEMFLLFELFPSCLCDQKSYGVGYHFRTHSIHSTTVQYGNVNSLIYTWQRNADDFYCGTEIN